MLVEVTVSHKVSIVSLSRPPVNALNLALVDDLAAQVAAAARDPECVGLVLTGKPGVFSAGIDTKEVPAYSAAERATMLRAVNRTALELYSLRKPAVAALSGHALGGGLVLALTCDVRLAARGEFRIGLTEAAAGVPFPAGPLAVLEAEVPPHARRFLSLTAAVAAPEDEVLATLIDRVVEPDELLAAAVTEVKQLAALRGHAAVKRQLRAGVVARLRDIVENDDEPLLDGWL